MSETTYESYKNKIAKFYRKNRRMPSYSEISDLLGFNSKNAVYKLVKKFVDDGFIAKDITGRLIPQNLFGGVRVLGTVAAGFPAAAEEELVDVMNLDEFLIDKREATFMLRVTGDSMIEAGICEGDMVLAERTNNPKPGEIVIAEVDGEWTMKYFKKRGSQVVLEPANSAYSPIVPQEELKIAAVVKAVIRKY